ncbi:AraC family transcriptional regulator [Aurantibacter sp.]|uniref:helix-turn-helix domain-containing protein n=1 Tax=Aurantibacter sp. TaxID=2807103 RepID=UPI003266E03A
MKINVKFDFKVCCITILEEQLNKLNIPHVVHGPGEVEIKKSLSSEDLNTLSDNLNSYGIEILDEQKVVLVERIKNTIEEMLEGDEAQLLKVSSYLSDKLNYSYAYLSNLFSETTFTSIENFIILRKVDRTKELMANTNLTLTEIAFRLNYSSVAHLSGQFKKTTGLTPTMFQKIMKRRKENSQYSS